VASITSGQHVIRRITPVACALGLLVACGGDVAPVDYAGPQTIQVDLSEFDGKRGAGFRLEVRQLRLTPESWVVAAAVTNATKERWWVRRPHFPGETKFGLYVSRRSNRRYLEVEFAAARTTPSLLAERFSPQLPLYFAPGQRWSGTFSGRGLIPRGRWVRFAFGRFQTNGVPPSGLPAGLMAVTDRAVWLS